MSDGQRPLPPATTDELHRVCELLEQLAEVRERLDGIDDETRFRLMKAAGALTRPDRQVLKVAARARKKRRLEHQRKHDAAIVSNTGMRTSVRAKIYVAPPPEELPAEGPRLLEPRNCYVCKADYDTVHAFYDSMCPSCATLNYARRFPKGNLTGRVALVTGSRLKIGFQTALILLRAGARVIATTRFPRDAAQRFAEVEDFASFADRIHVYGLDLRHIPSVELFSGHLGRRFPHLDILINNAAQTVRRPAAFYAHLLPREQQSIETLPEACRPLLRDHHALVDAIGAAGRDHSHGPTTLVQLPMDAARGLVGFRGDRPGVGLTDSASLSQMPCGDDDLRGDGLVATREDAERLFPPGHLDGDRQQIDLRSNNSWRMTLAEVPTGELLEVHLVNAVAPFVLCARLRPMMQRSPHAERSIVNVSAMEASFARRHKTDKHPHTNMAKAALNMLTRTSAPDYAKERIYMNSVDTGWVTDEDPRHHVARKQQVHAFYPPLDVVDGAARVLDPVFAALGSDAPPFGLFYKDYRVVPW